MLDNLNSTGLFFDYQNIVRGYQFNGGVIGLFNTKSHQQRWIDCSDVHDVLIYQESLFAVNTETNSIFQYDLEGREIQKWCFSDKKDSWHINCLAVWNGRLIFSAFGEFDSELGYRGNSSETGFVQEVQTGERIVCGLSQPHSLTPFGDRLLLANSAKCEIWDVSSTGKIKNKTSLNGYTRGLSVDDNLLHVGLSQSRNISVQSATCAVVAIDLNNWNEIGRLDLPSTEIYDIKKLKSDELSHGVVSSLDRLSFRLEQKKHDKPSVQSCSTYSSRTSCLKVKSRNLIKRVVSLLGQSKLK